MQYLAELEPIYFDLERALSSCLFRHKWQGADLSGGVCIRGQPQGDQPMWRVVFRASWVNGGPIAGILADQRSGVKMLTNTRTCCDDGRG
jgi:hypothetical protein